MLAVCVLFDSAADVDRLLCISSMRPLRYFVVTWLNVSIKSKSVVDVFEVWFVGCDV